MVRAALQAANKNLMDCMQEVYEPEWPGHDQIPVKAQAMDIYWDELCHKLNDQVTIPLSTYLSQFSEIRVSEIFFSFFLFWSCRCRLFSSSFTANAFSSFFFTFCFLWDGYNNASSPTNDHRRRRLPPHVLENDCLHAITAPALTQQNTFSLPLSRILCTDVAPHTPYMHIADRPTHAHTVVKHNGSNMHSMSEWTRDVHANHMYDCNDDDWGRGTNRQRSRNAVVSWWTTTARGTRWSRWRRGPERRTR